MALLSKLSRAQLLRVCSEFSAIDAVHDSVLKTANQALMDRIKVASEKLMPTDPAMKSRITGLQAAVGYTFRNPVLAQYILTHTTYPRKNKDEICLFKELKFIGDRMIGILSSFYLQETYPLTVKEEKGDRVLFPSSVVATISHAVTCNDYLGRLAVADHLLVYLRHQSSKDVCDKIKKFQLTVHEGRYNVRPPDILADSFESLAGGISADSGSPDAFYGLFLARLRIPQNPVFILFDKCLKDDPKGPKFPTLRPPSGKGGEWKVERFGSLIGEGNTMLEAADAANKNLGFA